MKLADLTKEEKLQYERMKEAGYSDDDIFQLISEDRDGYQSEEAKKLESKAKENGTLKVEAEKEKKVRKPRERKENPEKKMLVKLIAEALAEYNPDVVNDEREIDFALNGTNYYVTVAARRKEK